MRHIGHLPSVTQAQVFSDFLVTRGIRNEVEHEADGSWAIWIRDEDQVSAAQEWLGKYSANPEGAEFLKAGAEAARVREAEKKDLEEYRRRFKTARQIFPTTRGYGAGVLTYILIMACVAVFFYSKGGKNLEAVRGLFIIDPETTRPGQFLPQVFAGQVWRLFTPIFIHFTPLHIIFNMLWLFQLGCMIEGRQSTLTLAALVAVVALVSNLAEYVFSGPFFGGMSGVVYGLAGYIWLRGKYDRASGLYLDPMSITILLVWLVLCYTGAVGSVANTAHLAGLIVGVVWGWVSAYIATNRPG